MCKGYGLAVEGRLLTNGRTSKVLLLTHLIHQRRTGPWSCPRDRVSQGLEPNSLYSLVQRSPDHLQPLCLQLLPPGSHSIWQHRLPFGRLPAERWATTWMNGLSAFCPHPALPDELGRLTAPSPPEVFLLPRRWPGRTWPGWRERCLVL